MKHFLPLLLFSSAFGAGTVQQSISQLGSTSNWVLAFQWTGDSSNGTVPVTAAKLEGCCQGYVITQVETIPGTPNPTAGYSVAITDFGGVDALAGAANSLSATQAQAFAAAASAPPINGGLSLTLTGQSVASAKGTVYVFIQKPGSITASALRTQSFAGLTLGSVPVIFPNGTLTQDNSGFFYNFANHALLLKNNNCTLSVALCIGSGALQGYGMTGSGLDTPSLFASREGTPSNRNLSTFPSWTWSRNTKADYTPGLGNYTMYGIKMGGSNGMENETISTRVVAYPSDIVGHTNRVVMTPSCAISGATNASPIVLTFSSSCYLDSGQGLHISGVGGTTAANGDFTITVVDLTHVSLNGSTGNGVYTSGGTAAPYGPFAVTAATNATPIVITTATPSNCINNERIKIASVGGNTAANGNWLATCLTPTTLSLQGSVGNGAYTSGGTAQTSSIGWNLVGSCQALSNSLDKCAVLEADIDNESGVDPAGPEYSSDHLMNALAAVCYGNAKCSQAFAIVAGNPGVSPFMRGIDFTNGSLAAGAYAMLLPNGNAIGSRDLAGSTYTPLISQDSTGYTRLNMAFPQRLTIDAAGVTKVFWDYQGVQYPFHTTATGLGSLSVVKGAGPIYCDDCTTATQCIGGGSGHVAYFNGTIWQCQ